MQKLFFYIVLFFLALASCKTKQNVFDAPKDRGMNDTLARLNASACIIDGTTAKMRGQYEEALLSFEKCLRFDPKNATAYYHLSGLYDMAGENTRAMEAAKKAVQFEPDNNWMQLQLAFLYRKNNMMKESVEVFAKLVKKNPGNIDFYFPYSEALLYNNEPAKAVDVLNDLEKIHGFNEDIILQKYRIWSELKKYDKAIAEIEKLIKNNPYEVRNYGIIAEMYEEQGNREKAMEYYNKILEIEPGNGIVRLSLAQYYWNEGKKEKSWEELKLAFESVTLDIDTKMKILLDYYERSATDPEMKKEAYELIGILVRVHSNEAKAWSIYGDFLSGDKKFKEARDAFRKAVEMDKSVYLIWNEMMILSSQLNDWKTLYKDSKEAIELFPSQAPFYYFFGIAAVQEKKYEEAIEALLTGKELVLDNSLLLEFYQLLGDAFHKTGEHDNSDSYYEKALEIDPNNTYVLNNYAYYLSVRKIKLEKAAKMAATCNEVAPGQPSYQDTYAWILFQMKDFAKAELWLEKAVNGGGFENGVILEHYGDALFMNGKTDRALEYWKKAKEKGETSPQIDKKISDKKYYE
ncbi:MAG: tetratricopeptide repeat protein [Bacteroidota bacterium]